MNHINARFNPEPRKGPTLIITQITTKEPQDLAWGAAGPPRGPLSKHATYVSAEVGAGSGGTGTPRSTGGMEGAGGRVSRL